MRDIELINYVQAHKELFQEKVDVQPEFIIVEVKAILVEHRSMGANVYSVSKRFLNKIITEVDKDFDIHNDYKGFTLHFLRDGVSRNNLKEDYQKEMLDRLKDKS